MKECEGYPGSLMIIKRCDPETLEDVLVCNVPHLLMKRFGETQ
jgi:hypothetical protein